MDKKLTMALIGGAAALVAVAVGYHYLTEKSEAGGEFEEEILDLDAEIDEIGAIERDQKGMIKWAQFQKILFIG